MKDKIICYLSEALGLGLFMVSAGFFATIIEHPQLHIKQLIPGDILRRFIIGLTMGITAFFIINSPFGKKSGAHINPSVTIVQYRLGNISATDAFFYIVFQFIGSAMGVFLIYVIMPHFFSTQPIDYIVTRPFPSDTVAFIAEYIISFILITVVLYSNTNKKLSGYTATFVAILITIFITIEAPYSGMSMNPARTFGSAIIANQWPAFWLYCLAPPLGMISGELFVRKILKKDLKNATLQNEKANK